MLGTGERHVEQAAFLDEAAGVERALVGVEPRLDLLAVGGAAEIQRRQVGPVTAQVDGQRGDRREPRPGALGAGEDLVADVRKGDQLPLEPLGRVDGEYLDTRPAGGRLGDVDLARREPVLGLLRGVQVGQQRGRRRGAARRRGAGGEVGDDVGERVEVGAPGRAGARRGLDVEQQDPLDVGDEVDQRGGHSSAQHGELAGQPTQPRETHGRVARRGPRVVEGVDQAGALGVLAGERGRDRVGHAGADRAPGTGGGEPARAAPQGGEVGATHAPPRPGEQPHRGPAGQRVDHETQRRDDVTDLGLVQQPAEPDDLDGQVARAQRGGQRGHVGAAPHQHRAGRRAVAAVGGGAPPVGDGVGDPRALGLDVGVQGDADVAGRRARTGAEPVDGDVELAEGSAIPLASARTSGGLRKLVSRPWRVAATGPSTPPSRRAGSR